jgi:ABC-2 type transport system ATP-binding protein
LPDSTLSLSHVSKKLGGRQVLTDVSFGVEPGDIFGYLGPNGAGKTTSIRVLLGLLQPDAGRATVLGCDATVDATRQHVGFVLEADGLYENLSARDNLAYYARIYGIPQSSARIDQVLTLVKLQDRSRDKVGIYSKGMRQRLALARALLHNPDILILDEPTAGVDPSGQIEVRQLVLDMAGKQGKTILLSSHNLDEVQRICSRVALIDRGLIKLYGRLDELQRTMGGGEVVIETTEPLPDALLGDLSGQAGIKTLSRQDRVLTLDLVKDHMDVPAIIGFLNSRGARIEQVKRKEASLEEIYTTILREAEVR